MNTVQETNGVTDMFPSIPYTPQMRQDYCLKTWGLNVREDWPAIEFWGKNILSSSNIVFSNGVSGYAKVRNFFYFWLKA